MDSITYTKQSDYARRCPCSTYDGSQHEETADWDYEWDQTVYGPHSPRLTHIVKQETYAGGYDLFYVCENHAQFYDGGSFVVFKLKEPRAWTP